MARSDVFKKFEDRCSNSLPKVLGMDKQGINFSGCDVDHAGANNLIINFCQIEILLNGIYKLIGQSDVYPFFKNTQRIMTDALVENCGPPYFQGCLSVLALCFFYFGSSWK